MREEARQYERLVLTHTAHMEQVLPPLEDSGDRHHAITDPDEIIRLSGMSDSSCLV